MIDPLYNVDVSSLQPVADVPLPSVSAGVPWYESLANAVDTLTPAAQNVAKTITAFNQANTQNAAQQALTSTQTAPGQINLLGQAFSQYWWILVLGLVAILAIIFAVKQ